MFSFRTTPLEDQLDKALLDGRVGCFTTPNCWDPKRGRYVWELFKQRRNLAAQFRPSGDKSSSSEGQFDIDTLRHLDAVVVEIQDIGSRSFAFTRDVMRIVQTLTTLGDDAPAMYVADHLNPLGRVVEGTMPEKDSSFPRVAHRHGLTLGELCNLYYNEIGAKFPLHIISALASDSSRQLLPWSIPPAPDITGMFSSLMFVGGCLWNGTTISPGIGTSRAYEYIGAPFIEHRPLDALPAPEGVLMRACTFVPSAGPYAGVCCRGYQIILTPGVEYHSLLHTLQLMRWFSERYSRFELKEEFSLALADPVLEDYVRGHISYQDARDHVKTQEQRWIRKARRFCLYDDFPYRIK